MITTDDKIIELIGSKNTLNRGFKLLMDTYQTRLYHHIRSMTNNHDNTDDILQNTFVKVFRNINRFEGRSNLYTWLYRIATNEASSFLKKNKRINNYIENIEVESIMIAGIDCNEINGEFIKKVLNRAIKQLPEKQKAVFSLRYFEEMSYKDMSEIMGTSIGALKASYHHAVKKVETYVKQVALY